MICPHYDAVELHAGGLCPHRFNVGDNFLLEIEAVADYVRQFGEDVTTAWEVGALEDGSNDIG